MKRFLPLLLLLVGATAMADDGPAVSFVKPAKTFCYRVYFSDKKHNIYSTRRPEAFLSEKALKRRKKFKIKVDEYDLPVSPLYLEYLKNHEFKVRNVSKWNNTAVVEFADTAQIQTLAQLSFVKNIKKVWESPDSIAVRPEANRFMLVENRRDTLENFYGKGQHQIEMLNANKLHEQGFRGEGMTIAVIDGGFYNADCIEGLKQCNILGTRNFVKPGKSVYEETQQHGTMVLSCIAAQIPNAMVGTAPNAAFYLLQSEDNDSESMIEEDNWCAAVEYADSIGADMVSSSLGYYKFDDASTSHKYYEQDGKTAVNSFSASLAASRGLLILNSAGNEGDGTWKKIGFPGDARDILTVGAVNNDSINTLFSSLGNTADGRIKPDVMALGQQSALLNCNGNVTHANGTSFSTPILCGATACLWQAFPKAKPTEIIEAIQQAGHNVNHPDNIFGYGIPDMWKAYEYLKNK